jgi:D-alanyl-D-alanine carboxypeptidase
LDPSAKPADQAKTALVDCSAQLEKAEGIQGIVTKSANDAAVVVAEGLGHSEENFVKLMTHRARKLGMTNTTYVNASGLPDDGLR